MQGRSGGGQNRPFNLPLPHQPGPSTEGESNLEIFPPRKAFVYEATQRVSRPKWTWWMSTPPYEVAKLNFEPGPPRMGRNTSVFVMLLYIFLYAPFVLKSTVCILAIGVMHERATKSRTGTSRGTEPPQGARTFVGCCFLCLRNDKRGLISLSYSRNHVVLKQLVGLTPFMY